MCEENLVIQTKKHYGALSTLVDSRDFKNPDPLRLPTRAKQSGDWNLFKQAVCKFHSFVLVQMAVFGFLLALYMLHIV